MKVIEDLLNITNASELEDYIQLHSQEIHDYFNRSFNELASNKFRFRKYILLNDAVQNLDINTTSNVAFITLLLNFCERFSFGAPFQKLYEKITTENATIGNRLEAAYIFLCSIRNNNDFIEIYEEIINKLQIASCQEDDNPDVSALTFVNYFSKVLVDTAPNTNIIEQLRNKLILTIASGYFQFLKHNLIENLLNVDIANSNIAFENIQQLTDEFCLNKTKLLVYGDIQFIIESDTDYSLSLQSIPANFKEIRNKSVQAFNNIQNQSQVFYSLNRGVAILQEEAQMFSYMHSYANAHYEKLLSGFDFLHSNLGTSKIEIIDWACGQGIASMVLLEKFNNFELKAVHLIEPSELCLKRASLHIRKYDRTAQIKTINKDLDSLLPTEIITEPSTIKIHLFSNILDVDNFSLTKLLSLITESQKGLNYFVCSSPYITITKTDRIDTFVRFFKQNFPVKFENLAEINNTNFETDVYWNCNENFKGNRCVYHRNNGCGKKWTRVIRIFKVEL